MSTEKDPFEPLAVEEVVDAFAELSRRPASMAEAATPSPQVGVVTARFHGFDLDDRPLLTGLPGLECEIVVARTTTPLRRAQVGATAVALCERGNVRKPIIVGILQERVIAPEERRENTTDVPRVVSVQADDDRMVLSAEREIVLQCGDASITLTRAGKVLIKGSYVLSRSTGYNKIKGAAVDIN